MGRTNQTGTSRISKKKETLRGKSYHQKVINAVVTNLLRGGHLNTAVHVKEDGSPAIISILTAVDGDNAAANCVVDTLDKIEEEAMEEEEHKDALELAGVLAKKMGGGPGDTLLVLINGHREVWMRRDVLCLFQAYDIHDECYTTRVIQTTHDVPHTSTHPIATNVDMIYKLLE